MLINENALFMFGIQGKTLTEQELIWLKSPLTAGVILFSRNYENPEQITEFIATIRKEAKNDILISVDHEGGRVQRFRDGFTKIPAMAEIGKIYDSNKELGLELAKNTAEVLAYEIAKCDIDFSFAPVLDIQNPISTIISDRAFHKDPETIATIANSFYSGLKNIGMAGVGKHFPGHGNIEADSHLELPLYDILLDEIAGFDMLPFSKLINSNIEAIMPAHIMYTAIDAIPAGFSNFWLQQILRNDIGFNGCIISDDLDMEGAAVFGDITKRIKLAERNCDLILLCNNYEHIKLAFETQEIKSDTTRQQRTSLLFRKSNNFSHSQYKSAKLNLKNNSLIT